MIGFSKYSGANFDADVIKGIDFDIRGEEFEPAVIKFIEDNYTDVELERLFSKYGSPKSVAKLVTYMRVEDMEAEGTTFAVYVESDRDRTSWCKFSIINTKGALEEFTEAFYNNVDIVTNCPFMHEWSITKTEVMETSKVDNIKAKYAEEIAELEANVKESYKEYKEYRESSLAHLYYEVKEAEKARLWGLVRDGKFALAKVNVAMYNECVDYLVKNMTPDDIGDLKECYNELKEWQSKLEWLEE